MALHLPNHIKVVRHPMGQGQKVHLLLDLQGMGVEMDMDLALKVMVEVTGELQ